MPIRLVADNQNRLFWRAGTGLGYPYQGRESSDHAAELRNTFRSPQGAAPLGAGHIERFRRSSVVHGQDRDESRLVGFWVLHSLYGMEPSIPEMGNDCPGAG